MDNVTKHLQKTDPQSGFQPNPSGKQFLILFRKEADTEHLPYMHADSLDQDIILYRAMVIILSKRLGMLEEKLSNVKNDDQLTRLLTHTIRETEAFLQSKAMIILRDNEFASNHHENTARKECMQFLKE